MNGLKFLYAVFFFLLGPLGAIHYPLTLEPIDVVIPCHEKDVPLLDMCIAGIRENGKNIGRVYVISKSPFTKEAEWVDETLFPFSYSSVNRQVYREEQGDRTGWVFQQLLKFYAPFVIPEISSNVLIIDADTVFLNPVSFITEKGNPMFNPRLQYTPSYFTHMKKLLPSVKPNKIISAVTHHMLFQRAVLEDLFSEVEKLHQKPFWEAFCDCTSFPVSVPSEYEIYYHFFASRSKQPKLHLLKWRNHPDPSEASLLKQNGYHFASFHHYMRD
jgi:Family of unknown function (DUF6492)